MAVLLYKFVYEGIIGSLEEEGGGREGVGQGGRGRVRVSIWADVGESR